MIFFIHLPGSQPSSQLPVFHQTRLALSCRFEGRRSVIYAILFLAECGGGIDRAAHAGRRECRPACWRWTGPQHIEPLLDRPAYLCAVVAKPGLEPRQDIDEQRQPLTTGDIERAGQAARLDHRDCGLIVNFERGHRIPGASAWVSMMRPTRSISPASLSGMEYRSRRWFTADFRQQDHRPVGSDQAAGSFLAPAASLRFVSTLALLCTMGLTGLCRWNSAKGDRRCEGVLPPRARNLSRQSLPAPEGRSSFRSVSPRSPDRCETSAR